MSSVIPPPNSGESEPQSEKGVLSSEKDAPKAEAAGTKSEAPIAEVAGTKSAAPVGEAAASESAAAVAEAAELDSAAPITEVAEPEQPEELRVSTEVVELDAESLRPLPPSLRLKTAQDSTSQPFGVTSQLPPANWPPRVVADLMTRKIITVEEHEPVGNLEECMKRFKFRHLPVMSSDMKLVGLISRTDLLHAELGKMPDGTEAPKFDDGTTAGAIMRKNVVIARVDSPLETACRVMLEKKLTCLPVILENGTLVGILTDSDFVKLSLTLLKQRQ
jgi:CBS domain-containing protein